MVAVNGIAADQWGLLTAKQAAEQGVSGVRLKRLTDNGLLQHVGRGVYIVPGAGYPQHLEIKVAWLRLAPSKAAWQRSTTDPDSGVVSHTSACLLHDLGDIPAGNVEITVPRRRVTRDPDIHLLTGYLEPEDITLVDGLPVTTAERTIIDLLRARADAGHIGGVIADAEHRDLITTKSLSARVAPFAKAYGVAPAADGRVLIDHLVTQAGARLRADDVRDVARVAYGRGAADASRNTPVLQILAARFAEARPPDLLNPATREALRSIVSPIDDAVLKRMGELSMAVETRAELRAAMERMMTPFNEVVRDAITRLELPAINEAMREALSRLELPAVVAQDALHRLELPAADADQVRKIAEIVDEGLRGLGSAALNPDGSNALPPSETDTEGATPDEERQRQGHSAPDVPTTGR